MAVTERPCESRGDALVAIATGARYLPVLLPLFRAVDVGHAVLRLLQQSFLHLRPDVQQPSEVHPDRNHGMADGGASHM